MERQAYEELKELQNTHWWFVAKREIICSMVSKYSKKLLHKSKKEIQILDAGCGMGVLLHALSRYGQVKGMDADAEAAVYCNHIMGQKAVLQGELPDKIPYKEQSFDLIVSADCLEHIKDDYAALCAMRKLLKEGNSFLVLTVPAFMSLWSYNDEFVHHYRRYNRKQLISLAQKAGFHVQLCSYYNFWAFPAVFIIRKMKNLFHIRKDDLGVGGGENGLVNKILTRIFLSEKHRLLRNKRFPAGVSLILVADIR